MDLKNNLLLVQSLVPAARNSTGTGSSVDLQGSETNLVIVECGVITDGTHTPKVQESDASGSGFTDVAAADLIGSLAACTGSAVQAVEYKGNKRYIRVVLTVAGATTGAVASAVVAKGSLRHVGTAV